MKYKSCLLITALIFIICCTASAFFYQHLDSSINNYSKSINESELSFLRIVLINNATIFIYLLLGVFSFSIFSFCVFILNGISVTTSFIYFSKKIGLYKAAILVFPHGLIELTWLIGITAFSLYLSFYLKKLFDTSFTDNTFFRKLFSRRLLYLFVLLIISAFIESFLTFSILKKLWNITFYS